MKTTTLKCAFLALSIALALPVYAQWNVNGTHIYSSNSGSVSIGTNNPLAKLHVAGDVMIGKPDTRHFLTVVSLQYPEIRFQTPTDNGVMRIGVSHTSTPSYGFASGDLYVYSGSTDRADLIVRKTGGLILGLNGGNVGIGTPSPSEKLDLYGSLKLNGNAVYVHGGSYDPHYVLQSVAWSLPMEYRHYSGHRFITGTGNERMRLTADGNLGLGTASPENSENWNRVLDVNGVSNAKIITTASVSGIQAGIWASGTGVYGAPAGGISGTGSNHHFSIITNKISRMSILANGMIGIGITAPTQHLEIKGNLALGNGTNGTRWLFESRHWAGSDWLVIAGDKPDGSYDFSKTIMFERATGKVRIGTSSLQSPGSYKLYVETGILTEKVRVAVHGTSDWSDHVFDPCYVLKPLNEVEIFITRNKHLPEVPSAEQVVSNGIDVAQMDALLLKKIEELTLYVIEQNKRIQKLECER